MAQAYIRISGVLHPLGTVVIDDTGNLSIEGFNDDVYEILINALTYDDTYSDDSTLTVDSEFSDNTPTVNIV